MTPFPLLWTFEGDVVQLVRALDGFAACGQTVRLENVRYDVDHVFLGNAARIVERHGADDAPVEQPGLLLIPLLPKRSAFQWRSVLAALESVEVAGAAGLMVERLSVRGLRRRVDAG